MAQPGASRSISVKLVTEDAACILSAFIQINRSASSNAHIDLTTAKQHNNSDLNGNGSQRVNGANNSKGATNSSEFDEVDTGTYVDNVSKPNDNLRTVDANSPSPSALKGDGDGKDVAGTPPKKKKWTDSFLRKKKSAPKQSATSKSSKTLDKVVTGSSLAKDPSNKSVTASVPSQLSTSSPTNYRSPVSKAVRISKTANIEFVPISDVQIQPKKDNTQYGSAHYKFSSRSVVSYQGPSSRPISIQADGPSGQSKFASIHPSAAIHNVANHGHLPGPSKAPLACFDEDFIPPEDNEYDVCDSPNAPHQHKLVLQQKSFGRLLSDVDIDSPDGKDEAEERNQILVEIAKDLKRIGDTQDGMGITARTIVTTLGSSIFSRFMEKKLNYNYFSELVSRAVQEQPLGTQFLILCTMTADVVNRAAEMAIQADECIQGLTVDYIAENMSSQIASSGGIDIVLKTSGSA